MTIIKAIAALLLVLVLTGVYVVWVPNYGRSLGVELTRRGFQTNAANQAIPLYAASNTTAHPVWVMPIIEIRPPPYGAYDTTVSTQMQHLVTHGEIVFPLQTAPTQRPALMCQRYITG